MLEDEIESLEDEVDGLSVVVDNQSRRINELEKHLEDVHVCWGHDTSLGVVCPRHKVASGDSR